MRQRCAWSVLEHDWRRSTCKTIDKKNVLRWFGGRPLLFLLPYITLVSFNKYFIRPRIALKIKHNFRLFLFVLKTNVFG